MKLMREKEERLDGGLREGGRDDTMFLTILFGHCNEHPIIVLFQVGPSFYYDCLLIYRSFVFLPSFTHSLPPSLTHSLILLDFV